MSELILKSLTDEELNSLKDKVKKEWLFWNLSKEDFELIVRYEKSFDSFLVENVKERLEDWGEHTKIITSVKGLTKDDIQNLIS